MDDLIADLVAFRDAREWGRFHTLENLAKSITIEAGELLECFQWGESLDRSDWDHAITELADVLIYSLLMCHAMGVTPESIVRRKVAINAEKYPIDQWKGRARAWR